MSTSGYLYAKMSKLTTACLDSALKSTGDEIRFLNEHRHSIRSEHRPIVQALFGGLCNISGILFTLRQLVNDTDSKSYWHATAWVLCAPSGILQQYIGSLMTSYLGSDRYQNLETELVNAEGAVNRLKAIFTAVLQSNPLSAVLHEIFAILLDTPVKMFKHYDDILMHVPVELVQKVHCAFQWIVFSRRPLCLEELAEIANYPWKQAAQTENYSRIDAYKIIENCLGLLVVRSCAKSDLYEQQVVFAHQTVKDYLLCGSMKPSPAAVFATGKHQSQTLISNMTVSYLRFTLEKQPSRGSGSKSVHLPLLKYSRNNWYHHYLKTRKDGVIPDDTCKLVIDLFDEMRTKHTSQGIEFSAVEAERPEMVCSNSWIPPSPLYCASLWGMAEVVRLLLMRGDQPDQEGGFCGTPLQAAAYNGDVQIVTMLLDKKASINATSGHLGNALEVAAYRGHKDIVQILWDTCANSIHALQAAAAGDHEKLAEWLMVNGADVNSTGGIYQPGLVSAAKIGNKELTVLLIENGADCNIREVGGQNHTALYRAATLGHSEIVRLLLMRGADPNAEGEDEYSPLEAAVKIGSKETVEILLRKDARCDSKEIRKRVNALLGRQIFQIWK